MKFKPITFYSSVLSLIMLFAASSSPIPLYSFYQTTIKISTSAISLTAVSYFAGCLLSLLVLSRLSEVLGGKKCALLSISFGMVGLCLLLVVNSQNILILARFFQGLSCGLASSIFSVNILRSGEGRKPTLVNAILGSSVYIGLAFGSLLSGTLAQIDMSNLNRIYSILLVLTIFCFLGVCLSYDFGTRVPFSLRTLIPKLFIPLKAKKLFPVAFCIFVGTWTMGGYFQAFSSTIASSVFHYNSTLISGVILSLFMIPNYFGARFSNYLTNTVAKKYGMLLFAVFISMMYVTFRMENFVFFCIVTILAGISQGVCYTTAMKELQENASENERTSLLSVIYLVSYGGAAIPNLLASRLASKISFSLITLSYLMLVIIMLILSWILLHKNNDNQ